MTHSGSALQRQGCGRYGSVSSRHPNADHVEMRHRNTLHRRSFLQLAAAAGLAAGLPLPAGAAVPQMATRRIPAGDEDIPVIGLGTSDEFERIPDDGGEQLKEVLTTLVEHGGSLVDTAPGYGDAERILGEFVRELGLADELFLSTKVQERGQAAGVESLERSLRLLPKAPLDLMMVHSLVDAATQLDNLQALKDAGKVRYVGITTSRRSGFEEMERLIRGRRFDFIQVNYSPLEPEAADRVIPAAADRGVAVMVNRAFGNGGYFGTVGGHALPDWAGDFDCESWAQFSIKYILSNLDVTCVLTATSNPRHMADNARGGAGRLPDAASRKRIEEYLRGL
jgi:aryl-alcohol dehydrogenase-like predicted oxidoreductase